MTQIYIATTPSDQHRRRRSSFINNNTLLSPVALRCSLKTNRTSQWQKISGLLHKPSTPCFLDVLLRKEGSQAPCLTTWLKDCLLDYVVAETFPAQLRTDRYATTENVKYLDVK